MRFSSITVLMTLALTSTSLAIPLKRSLVNSSVDTLSSGVKRGATISGIAKTVVQSVQNPKLTAARLAVIQAMSDTQRSISDIASQAATQGNSAITSLVITAQGGLSSAHQGIDTIGSALVSGNKPSVSDQKAVAVGIKTVRDAVNQMAAAITTPDTALSSNIATAQSNVQSLQNGGQDILTASGLTFADLGLPNNFATS